MSSVGKMTWCRFLGVVQSERISPDSGNNEIGVFLLFCVLYICFVLCYGTLTGVRVFWTTAFHRQDTCCGVDWSSKVRFEGEVQSWACDGCFTTVVSVVAQHEMQTTITAMTRGSSLHPNLCACNVPMTQGVNAHKVTQSTVQLMYIMMWWCTFV